MARPKGYNQDEVLDRALDMFRERGYVGASINDLVRATGVNRYSLYETFGDKRGLFVAAFNQFHTRRLETVRSILNQPGPKLPLFREYFERLCTDSNGCGPISCQVTVSAVSLANVDDEFATHVLKHSLALHEVFVETLQQARDQGEIEVDIDLKSLAHALINAGRGMRIIAPFVGFNDTITSIIEATLGLLRPTVAIQNERSVK